MKLHMLLAWGVISLLALGMALPSRAEGKDRSNRGRVSVRITIGAQTAQDDATVYHHWYDGQMRGYDTIDEETGERYSDVLQLVEEVQPSWLLVSNREDSRRSIVFNQRTRVTFEDIRPSWAPPGLTYRNRTKNNGNWTINRIQPGDLVIAQGYLNANGKFMATTVRVVGHAWGSYDDNYYDYSSDYGRPSYDGQRAYGEVRLVDRRRDQIEVRSNIGYRTIVLGRDGDVLIANRHANIDDLQVGDRVVFYFNRDTDRTIEAYRIVLLRDRDTYPRDNEACWCDPNYNNRPSYNGRTGANDRNSTQGIWIDGSLDTVKTGFFINQITLRVDRGRTITVVMPRTMSVIDTDGQRIALKDLRDGENLRIYYTDVDGQLNATRVICR